MYLEPNNPSLSFANFLDAAIRETFMTRTASGSSRRKCLHKQWEVTNEPI